jgi:glycosyltransferase involved in cell wall biosynthesis
MSSVTVIIPAYNSVPFLEETVASALAQSDPPERIVIVDDGSPDESFALAQRLERAHPTVQALQRPNGGAGAARNTGLAQAETAFVLFLDADDRLLPDAIAPAAGPVRPSPRGGDGLWRKSDHPRGWGPDRPQPRARTKRHSGGCGDLCDALARRNACIAAAPVEAVGGFNENAAPRR